MNPTNTKTSRMAKVYRKLAVLEFLAHHNLALPPRAIWVNLRRRNATFSAKTVSRHLSEMEQEGYVRKLESERGYYEVTEEGVGWLGEYESTPYSVTDTDPGDE